MTKYVVLKGGRQGQYQFVKNLEARNLQKAHEKVEEMLPKNTTRVIVPKTHWNLYTR